MNKKLYFGLAAAAMLTACSQDEVIDVNKSADAIRVSAAVEANSRAANSYCDEVLPAEFNLTATVSGKFTDENTEPYKYFDQDKMVKGQSSSTTANYTFAAGDRYWTEDNLDFYAWHSTNTGVTFTLGAVKATITDTDGNTSTETIAEAKFEDFVVNTNVEEQEDLLYALNLGVESKKTVQLQFHHALSQVVFNAANENPNININIKEVGFYGLYNGGNFIWPNALDVDVADEMLTYTKSNILAQAGQSMLNQSRSEEGEDEDSEDGESTISSSYGWYLNSKSNTADYTVKLDEGVEIALSTEENETITPLTYAPADHTTEGGWANVLQLMPQRSYGIYSLQQANKSMLAQANQAEQGVLKLLQKPGRRGMTIQHNASGYYSGNLTSISGLYFNVPEHAEDSPVYIKVSADITTTDAYGNEITLYSSEKDGETNYFYIPVSIFWQPGIRYAYTLTFSANGGGGITDPENPENVLDNVVVLVNVDEYDDANQAVQPGVLQLLD